MECKDCDRSPDCEHKIDATYLSDVVNRHRKYAKGKDCPFDWYDKKAEDMTYEQAIEAVKALRSVVASRITYESNAEENLMKSGLYTYEEAKKITERVNKKHEEIVEKNEWKADYKKPPLGCKPAQLVCTDRIKIVADAISRYADSPNFNSQLVKRWATEILLQCEIFERC